MPGMRTRSALRLVGRRSCAIVPRVREAQMARDLSTGDVATYIARMLAGLHQITETTEELAMLGYLIDVAREEAEALARRSG